MPLIQYARGLWAKFSASENPFSAANGMNENLRCIDDHLGLYTLLAPQAPGTALPGSPADGDGQIYTNGTYATFNGGTWKTYPARVGVRAVLASGTESWLCTGAGWGQFSVLDTGPATSIALAAKVAAELARDASFVTGPKYATEAIGRAAVGDGINFLVQGSGDVAAYEYRRANSSTSVLVATYPSKAYIDSGKGFAGTAVTAAGAGYETFNPDAANHAIVTAQPGSVSITKGKVGYPISVSKAVTTGSSTWFGVHLKIPYAALSDLDKTFNLNALTLSGVAPNNVNIVKELSDWNPLNNPVGISTSAMLDGGAGVNLYQAITASAHASAYQARTYLHIVLAYFNPSRTAVDAATAGWSIRPQFSSDLDVIANKVTSTLMSSLVSEASAGSVALAAELEAVAELVSIPKAPITSISANKQYPASTATVGAIYTRADAGGNVNIGYDVTLLSALGYAYSSAKLFNNYTADAATKKYRVFVKSNDKTTTLSLMFTNAASWGSDDGSIGMAQATTVTLNAANGYQATVDIDYATKASFYAAANRLQAGFFILAYESVMTEAVQLATYCYEVTASSATGMGVGYVPTVLYEVPASISAAIAALDADVAELQSDVQPPANITCWGDSLTAGGGWTTTLQTLTALTVYNGGTGGENSRAIMARQGGDVMVANNITIPATTTPVLIADRDVDGGIKTMLGATVTPLLQGGAHVNPCKIGGIVGTLSWTGASYADMTGNWVFTRATAGSEVQVTRATAIRTDFDMNRNGGIQIIFIGQNGGYTSNDDLIWQHRMMIEHSTAKHTLILGLSSGSAAVRADYEAAMKLAFGRYFISLREYLATPIYSGSTITSCYGLQDAGITPTSADLAAIATGTVPPSLLADSVHYNTACKTVIGNMVYARMRDLNIV